MFLFAACAIGCKVQPIGTAQSELKVIEVIDGDTVKLSNRKLLRYIGIDTPEIRHKTAQGFQYQPEPFSLEAKALNQKLVEGKVVRIEYDVQRTDAYGRLLGYCFVKDEHDNEIMADEEILKEGLALLLTMPPNVKYTERFTRAQEYARQHKSGIWAAYVPVEADKAAAVIGKVAAVQGRVVSCYNSGNVLFLDFGRDYRTDFTAVIFKKDMPYFQKKGINPYAYKGKRLEIIGKVKEYNGPEIIVRDPSHIRVLDN